MSQFLGARNAPFRGKLPFSYFVAFSIMMDFSFYLDPLSKAIFYSLSLWLLILKCRSRSSAQFESYLLVSCLVEFRVVDSGLCYTRLDNFFLSREGSEPCTRRIGVFRDGNSFDFYATPTFGFQTTSSYFFLFYQSQNFFAFVKWLFFEYYSIQSQPATGNIFLYLPRWLFQNQSRVACASQNNLAFSATVNLVFFLYSLVFIQPLNQLKTRVFYYTVRLRRVKVSLSRLFLINSSRGESVSKLGRWLTSMSQGFTALSFPFVSIISKPRIQKQMLFMKFQGWQALYWCYSQGWPAIIVLMITLSMSSFSRFTSQPCSSSTLQTEVSDLLWPTSIFFYDVLNTNFQLFLLIAQLVRWRQTSFRFSELGGQQSQVANRASPYSQMQSLSGFEPATSTQIRKSNFSPLSRRGFVIYR